MLIYRRTSILESPAQTLVNTVNCVGVMGKGLAHAFKAREPGMFEAYKRICDAKALVPGKLWLWRGIEGWVLNFPTKRHWRHPSKLDWIEQGLEKFVAAYESQGIVEVSFPQLGCGNGGLDWNDVRPLMEHYLSKVSIPVYVHDYTVDVGLPEHLQSVAAALRQETPVDRSFDSFIDTMRRAIDLSSGLMATLEHNGAFTARMNAENDLSIEMKTSTCTFERDDLRGVWLDLQNGLVTKHKAGWSVRDGADPLLSMLSVLPNVRPVQIQRAGSPTPEYAVEPCPQMQGSASTKQPKQQHELAWR